MLAEANRYEQIGLYRYLAEILTAAGRPQEAKEALERSEALAAFAMASGESSPAVPSAFYRSRLRTPKSCASKTDPKRVVSTSVTNRIDRSDARCPRSWAAA